MSFAAQIEFEGVMVDFQNGLQLLAMLLDWTTIEMNRETIPTQLVSFQSAYVELLKRRNAGLLDTGNVVISDANLAIMSRIQEILAFGLEAEEVRKALPQLRELIDQCVRSLTEQAPPRVDNGIVAPEES